ncbi:hypothetical protein ERC79_09110 [Rhodococcus sp. ABRD24]|uniref:hypothetical protein n=1 Tax=Rhodococcus sp. ABRD24 TaxID=2507582 RepID=UPI00103D4924|nr:hypothetical protein [Rhodococcus sp. ABRD24]QBJ96115.1 hypothetical protein ERC79_09110 [Rhodococcus sp. ABRD24]
MTAVGDLARLRVVADAVLYEGYLLYPYRSTSGKNQSRWQFGVLGPSGAAHAGVGEDPAMSVECVLDAADIAGDDAAVTPILRFLQLQARAVEQAGPNGFEPVSELTVDGRSWISWDEASPVEIAFDACTLAELCEGMTREIRVPGGVETESLGAAGRLVRTREPLCGKVSLAAVREHGAVRLSIEVRNDARIAEPGERVVASEHVVAANAGVAVKDTAIRHSFIGAHLILGATGTRFVSLLDPPDAFADAVAACRQFRCYPVLAGAKGVHGTSDVVLAAPIILYDHPEVAEESGGNLFDSTEIDEILTLRVMTLTDEEKAQARATDPLAAQIIDRCDGMTASQMQQLHGALRDPRAFENSAFENRALQPGDFAPPTFVTPSGLVPDVPDDVPWWDPAADNSVRPDADGVLVSGVRIAKGGLVRLRPSRRADAQDLFFAGQVARVATVHADVDGGTHIGVVLVDDPAAELHDWYGRYLYFAPDEVEPLRTPGSEALDREERQS